MKRLKPWGTTKIVPIAACFIFNDSGQLLVLKRHRQNLGGGKWAAPAGRLEPGENGLEAMTREIFEETGLTVSETHFLGEHLISMPHGTVSMSSFTTNVPNGTRIVLSPDEHEDFAWINPEDTMTADNILWGLPTFLRDFGYLEPFEADPTLADGSVVTLLSKP